MQIVDTVLWWNEIHGRRSVAETAQNVSLSPSPSPSHSLSLGGQGESLVPPCTRGNCFQYICQPAFHILNAARLMLSPLSSIFCRARHADPTT
jgi:hypothetical protein